jgi:hypothetical protein
VQQVLSRPQALAVLVVPLGVLAELVVRAGVLPQSPIGLMFWSEQTLYPQGCCGVAELLALSLAQAGAAKYEQQLVV